MSYTVKKIAYLDGIRGVAAFLVFLHHFLLAFYPAFHTFDGSSSNISGQWDVKFGQSFFSVLSNGSFCVFIFFVLSGFVLSNSYFQTERFETIVSGAQRRFIRLYIPVAFTLCLAYLMMICGLFSNVQVAALRNSGWWMGGFWTFSEPFKELYKCLLVETMFKGNSNFDTSLWTIRSEFSGSLFVFAFLALCHKIKKRGLILFLVFLYTFLTDQPILAAFVAGVSLNYVVKSTIRQNKFKTTVIALLLFVFALILGSYPSEGPLKDTMFEHLGRSLLGYPQWCHMLGAFLLILAFIISDTLQSFASIKPFRFLGRISFSLYLLHPLLIGSFSCFMYLKIYGNMNLHLAVFYVFIITTVICLFFSWLMTKYVDDKGVVLSKYVYNRWFKSNTEVVD